MRRRSILLALLLPTVAAAQEPARPAPPIQDNSFLMEEAYNQEHHVVQHISVFMYDRPTKAWQYLFTQEWPFRGQAHQVSYTVPFERAGGASGVGDLLLNYRYQLVGSGATRVAVAPRLSLALPTGSESKGFGSGSLGIQAELPVSWVLSPRVVTHWNAGGMVVPSNSTASVNLGQSFVVLVSPTVNFMLETVWTHDDASSQVVMSPGIRWAYNLPGGLQIVPGFAVPIGLNHSGSAVILYLSFEHPY